MFGVSAFRKLEEDVIMPKWCVAKNLQKKKEKKEKLRCELGGCGENEEHGKT
jgi:hypothetical protein